MSLCSKCKVAPPVQHQRYCLACRAAYTRAHRPKYADLSPEQKRRANTRTHTRMLIARGKLERKPCWCGKPGEAHHEDYSDPRRVEFLCREHHINGKHTIWAILTVLIDRHAATLRGEIKCATWND